MNCINIPYRCQETIVVNNIEKVKKMGEIAVMAFEGLLRFKEAEVRKYQNVEHIMTQENEVLIPSRCESYSFDRKMWDVTYISNYIMLTKKK